MHLTGRNKTGQKCNRRDKPQKVNKKVCERLAKNKEETVAALHQREFSSQAKRNPNRSLQICRPMLKKGEKKEVSHLYKEARGDSIF